MSWKIKFKLFQISTYSIFFVAVAIMCLLTGKYIESITLFISFVFIRYAFPKTYHSNSFWNCIAISVVIFIIAITFVPNKNMSLFSSVIFGMLIDYIAYKYKDYQDLIIEHRKPFGINNCTEAELVKRCKSKNYNELKTKIAIKFFVNKEKPKSVWIWLCETENYNMEWDSVKQLKYKMKKDLF